MLSGSVPCVRQLEEDLSALGLGIAVSLDNLVQHLCNNQSRSSCRYSLQSFQIIMSILMCASRSSLSRCCGERAAQQTSTPFALSKAPAKHPPDLSLTVAKSKILCVVNNYRYLYYPPMRSTKPCRHFAKWSPAMCAVLGGFACSHAQPQPDSKPPKRMLSSNFIRRSISHHLTADIGSIK